MKPKKLVKMFFIVIIILSQVGCFSENQYTKLDKFEDPFYKGSKYDDFLMERLRDKGLIYENDEYTKDFYVNTNIYYADKKRMIFSIQKCYNYMPYNLPENLPDGLDFTERVYFNEYLYEYIFSKDDVEVILAFPPDTKCFSAVVEGDAVYASCVVQNLENKFIPSEYRLYKSSEEGINVIETGLTDHVYNPPLLAKMGKTVIFTYKVIDKDYTYKGIKKILDDDTTEIIYEDKKPTKDYYAEILSVDEVSIMPIIYTTDKNCLVYVTNMKREHFAYIFDENGLVEEIDMKTHKKVTEK